MSDKKVPGNLTEEMLCAEYTAVYRYALLLCRNPEDAADLVQETFLRAFHKKDTFSGGSSLYTWLCAIARNTWLGSLSKREREMPVRDINSCRPERDAAEEDFSGADDQELLLKIYSLLEDMREPYKEVFCLRVFGNLSYEAIGKMFGKSNSWSRVTFFRARKILAEELRKDQKDES